MKQTLTRTLLAAALMAAFSAHAQTVDPTPTPDPEPTGPIVIEYGDPVSKVTVGGDKTGVAIEGKTNAGTGNAGIVMTGTVGDKSSTVTLDGTSVRSTVGKNTAVVDETGASMSANDGTAKVEVTDGTAKVAAGGSALTVTDETAKLNVGGKDRITAYDSEQTIAAGDVTNSKLVGQTYGLKVDGNVLVKGNLHVDGALNYSSSGSSGIDADGSDDKTTSKLEGATQGTKARVGLVVKGDKDADDSTATESRAEVTLTNGLGKSHGLQVYEDRTVLSGGTQSSSILLNDSGVTFRNGTGGPARVTGVADGVSQYDAVNFGQMEKAYAGVASAAALAAIPDPVAGKYFSLGVGVSSFEDQHAVAVGLRGAVTHSLRFQVGAAATSNADPLFNAGVGFSW